MPQGTDTIRLDGSITVSFYAVDNRHCAHALQFDLLGTGASRYAALEELEHLIEDYLEAVIEALEDGEAVRFFNPAAASDWNMPDATLEDFAVVVEVRPETTTGREGSRKPLVRLQDLPASRPRIEHLHLHRLAGV